MVMARLADFTGTRELTLNLTLRELRGRYKRSLLGWTWSLINPLATVAIYTVVFSYFLKIEPPVGHPSGLHNFALFLLCALIPWNFFSNGINGSMGTLIGNGNLIKKVYFPRELLVVSTIASLVVTLAIEFAVLGAILLFVGNFVLPWLPVLVAIVAIQTVFVLGVGLMLAPCNVYYRDIQHLVGIALQVLFYMTPIVYPIRFVPRHADIAGHDIPVRALYELNPLVRFVEMYRDVLYDLRFPTLADWAYVLAWAVALFALGMWTFSKLDRRLAEEV
jgi:ABC-type polysaccharide/polyol phosphate export permease